MANFCGAILLSVALIGSPLRAQPNPDDLASAKELLRSGQPDRAMAQVDPIIAQAMLKDAKDPKATCPGEAVAVLRHFMKGNVVLSVQNDWCDAMLVKGYALNELKRPQEAEEVLGMLVGHDPGNANYLVEYAYTVRVNGRLDDALALYRRAEKIASQLPDKAAAARWRAAALQGEGFALSDQGRWDEAEKAYRRSLRYEPESEIARHELRYVASHGSRETTVVAPAPSPD